MHYRLYFATALILTAVLMQWNRPSNPLPAEVSVVQESSWLRNTLKGLPAKLIPKKKHAFARGMRSAPAPLSPSPRVEKPKVQSKLPPINPEPSRVEEGERTLGVLSIRDLSLGMSLREAKSLKGNGKYIDRLSTYWKWPAGYARESRVGVTWLDYGRYHGSFDIDGICGAVYGDGLERSGVPILACGDTGEDVERLLGAPNGANHTWGTRHYRGVTWSYNLGNSYLSVYFVDGVVSRFIIQENGFSDSAC